MENRSGAFPVRNGLDLEKVLQDTEAGLLNRGLIDDRENVYRINRIFDQIRDVLMENQEDWVHFSSLYWQKKYFSYSKISQVLGEKWKKEYQNRMGHEFRRAVQLGQTGPGDFKREDWKKIQGLMDSACGYTGAKGVWKQVSPHLPGWLRQKISGTAVLAVKMKRMVGGKDE